MNLSDSSLPIGRFAHSYGVEPLVIAGFIWDCESLNGYIMANLTESVAPTDGVATFWSHQYFVEGNHEALHGVDRLLTCIKLCSSARLASESSGRELLRILTSIQIPRELNILSNQILEGRSKGNVAVVFGAATAALGLTATEAVLMEMRSATWGMLSAAVRLGLISAGNAQSILFSSGPVLEEAAWIAANTGLEEMESGLPDAEVFYLRHRYRHGRNFSN